MLQNHLENILSNISNMTTYQRFNTIISILETRGIPYTCQQDSKYAKNLILFPENLNKPFIVFTAHYDIVKGSSGANDNGSSIALLIELASYLKDNHKSNIAIVFLDKEEYGGFGCELFCSQYEPEFIINMDVCGAGSDIVFMDELRSDSPYLQTMRNIVPPKFIETDNMPYCDGRHAWSMGHEIWSISVFPRQDTELMSKIRMTEDEKIAVRNHKESASNILYRYPARPKEIYHYMHNGDKDTLEYINYNLMTDIYNYIVMIAEVIGKS